MCLHRDSKRWDRFLLLTRAFPPSLFSAPQAPLEAFLYYLLIPWEIANEHEKFHPNRCCRCKMWASTNLQRGHPSGRRFFFVASKGGIISALKMHREIKLVLLTQSCRKQDF